MESILKIIADNPVLQEELKKTILNEFAIDKDLLGQDLSSSDEYLGQCTRARISGVRAIERAFGEINKHKTIKEETEDNPGR